MGDSHSDSIGDIVSRFKQKFYLCMTRPSALGRPAYREPGSVDKRDIEDSLIELGTFAVMLIPETGISMEHSKDKMSFISAMGAAAYGYSPQQIQLVVERVKTAKTELRVGFRKNGEFKGFSLTQILADYGDSFINEVFRQQTIHKEEQGRYFPARDDKGDVSPLVKKIAAEYCRLRAQWDAQYKFKDDCLFHRYYMRLVHGVALI